MTKADLVDLYSYFDLVQSVTHKAFLQIPRDKLDFRPTPNVRSVRELVVHIFASERVHALAAVKGKLTQEDLEREHACGMATADLLGYAEQCHADAKAALDQLRDVDAEVETFYGTFPAHKMFTFSYDEHWHHRGQLYTYLRLLGIEPVFLYDY